MKFVYEFEYGTIRFAHVHIAYVFDLRRIDVRPARV